MGPIQITMISCPSLLNHIKEMLEILIDSWMICHHANNKCTTESGYTPYKRAEGIMAVEQNIPLPLWWKDAEPSFTTMPRYSHAFQKASAMLEAEVKVVKVIQAKVVELAEFDSKVEFNKATSDDVQNQQEIRLEIERLYKQFAEGAIERRKDGIFAVVQLLAAKMAVSAGNE